MHPATLARNLVPPIVLFAAALARAQPPIGETFPISERPARVDATSPSCQPAWPAASLKAGVTGTTAVRMVVDERGRISRSEVVHASGPSLEHRLLDYAFQQALATCPYYPGIDPQGHASGGIITASYTWQLPADAAAQR